MRSVPLFFMDELVSVTRRQRGITMLTNWRKYTSNAKGAT